ncbi:TPA: hypothetical protein RQK54_002688 [Vibrio vulnificus]|nr:hypothetical protein [Vibrio vulnificus]
MHDGLSLSGISIACGGLAMWIGSPAEALAKCALCLIKLNIPYISSSYEYC